MDPQVDRLISSIVDRLTNLVRSLRPTNPVAVKAQAFLAQWFPNGAGGITFLSYEEQLEEVEGLLGVFSDEEVKKDLELFGLTVDVQELADLAPHYRAEIENLPPKDLKYPAVVEARQAGQTHLLRTAAKILANYDSPELAEMQEKLLAPILDQQQRLAEAAKLGKKAADVDPDTGQETQAGAGG